jgi:hypothetical protein
MESLYYHDYQILILYAELCVLVTLIWLHLNSFSKIQSKIPFEMVVCRSVK